MTHHCLPLLDLVLLFSVFLVPSLQRRRHADPAPEPEPEPEPEGEDSLEESEDSEESEVWVSWASLVFCLTNGKSLARMLSVICIPKSSGLQCPSCFFPEVFSSHGGVIVPTSFEVQLPSRMLLS